MYYNYKVQFFPREEGPGASVFHKDAKGNIFIRIRLTDVDWSP